MIESSGVDSHTVGERRERREGGRENVGVNECLREASKADQNASRARQAGREGEETEACEEGEQEEEEREAGERE